MRRRWRRRCSRSSSRGERTHKEDGSLAGVEDSQLLVLAGREDSGAVAVPADTVDHVAVDAVHPDDSLATGHVPQDDHVIAAWGEEGKEGEESSHGRRH